MPYTITVTDESGGSTVAELTGVTAETLLSEAIHISGTIDVSTQPGN